MVSRKTAVIRERMARYLKGAEFDRYFQQLHLPAPMLWAAGIIAPITIVGFPMARSAWKKIRAGDVRTGQLRRRYRELADSGQVVFTYVVVANSLLTYQPKIVAPALVIGNFNQGKDDRRILAMRDRLADAALGMSENGKGDELTQLLGDLDYTFGRRRRIPEQHTGGVEVMAFDLQIVGEYLPTRKLQTEVIPCLAEPGSEGLICMIPFKLIQDVMDET